MALINRQKPRPKNDKCENCHEKNCEFLEYDNDLGKWICDACRNGKEIEKSKVCEEEAKKYLT